MGQHIERVAGIDLGDAHCSVCIIDASSGKALERSEVRYPRQGAHVVPRSSRAPAGRARGRHALALGEPAAGGCGA